MAKKIRFPLNLAEGKQARDLTELREFFSLPEVLGYVANGKLVTWLSDRYESDLAEQISALDFSDPDFEQQICEVLGVAYQGGGMTLADAQARNEKLVKLKEFTDEKKFLDNVDSVAFDQEDVYDLLDEDFSKIYLCGKTFTIPIAKENVTYIGVNNPTVVITSKEVVDFGAKKLVFEGVVFEERYQTILKSHEAQAKDKEEALQRREEALQRREKEILQREEALEREKEDQLPLNKKITLNLAGTLLAHKKETLLQYTYTQGIPIQLQLGFDQNHPDHFRLDISSRQIGGLGTLDYSFEDVSRCTKKWVLHDLRALLYKTHGDTLRIGAVNFFPHHCIPYYVLEKYNFIET